MRRATAILLVAFVCSACAREPGLFSEQNARAHIGMLAGTIGSRPVGTRANARARAYIIDQLRLFGFEVRVQEADARRRTIGRTARVSNIIAIRQGRRPEAVGLVSHYDSVPAGPGAGDDALGVGVSLEAARVLAARSDPNWTVMVLVTDGEEVGLMGAAALMTDREITGRLNAYVNMESIGAAGPPMLFEVGPGNAWLLAPWIRQAPYPRGGSFVTEIYRRLPNDTDFSILKLQGIPGLNIAAVGDSYAYHTAGDTPERLSPRTVRQMGEQLVTIVNALDGIDITQRSTDERTFFDVAGAAAASYGRLAGIMISIVALLFGVIAWVKVMAAAVRAEGLARWLLSCFWILLGTVLVVASMVAATSALRVAREVFHPWYARPDRLFLLLVAVAATFGWSIARFGRWLPPRAHGLRHPIVAWTIALPVWLLLAIGALWLIPGAAYLWVLPLLTAGVLLTLTPSMKTATVRLVSIVVLLVAGTLWIPNTVDLLRFAVAELGRFPVVTPAFVFATMMTAAGLMVVPPLLAATASIKPVLHPALATALCSFAVAVTAGFAYVAPAYTSDAPLRRYARVLQEGEGAAVWDVGSLEPGLDLGEGAPGGWKAVDTAPTASVPARRLPHPFVFRAAGPGLGPAPVRIAGLSAEPVAAGLEFTLTVVPDTPGLAVTFVLPAGIQPARSNLPGVMRLDRWTATYFAVPPDGIVFRATFVSTSAAALKGFRVVVSTQGSARGEGWTLPAWLPQERVAWTAEANWILDPFALPIAPVPPLR
jgi:Peptidase family M28